MVEENVFIFVLLKNKMRTDGCLLEERSDKRLLSVTLLRKESLKTRLPVRKRFSQEKTTF